MESKKRRESKWTNDELVNAVKSSFNYSQVLRKLGLRVAGGNHKSIKYWIAEFNIDTSHFNKDYQLEGLSKRRTLSKDVILCENSTVSKGSVKIWARRLIKQQCAECGNIGFHNDKPLILQLDHINGISNDNRIENLRWLCPNCHSQTDTFAGKKAFDGNYYKGNSICKCGRKKYFRSKNCRKCDVLLRREKNTKIIKRTINIRNKIKNRDIPLHEKIMWPNINELEKIVRKSSFLQAGKQLGISDTAIKKRFKKFGIEPKSIRNIKDNRFIK